MTIVDEEVKTPIILYLVFLFIAFIALFIALFKAFVFLIKLPFMPLIKRKNLMKHLENYILQTPGAVCLKHCTNKILIKSDEGCSQWLIHLHRKHLIIQLEQDIPLLGMSKYEWIFMVSDTYDIIIRKMENDIINKQTYLMRKAYLESAMMKSLND